MKLYIVEFNIDWKKTKLKELWSVGLPLIIITFF